MLIALDLDHTVIDLANQARLVMAADLGLPIEEVVQTFIYHRCFSHSDPEVQSRIDDLLDHAFWERPEVMSDPVPMPGAVEAVHRLYDAGMLAAYVTRRSPAIADVTRTWLRRHGLPDVPVHFVGHVDPTIAYASCKTDACRASGADILVDDSQDEIAKVIASGLGGILLDAPVGRAARAAFLKDRPDVLCLASIVEAVDHLLRIRAAA